VQASIDQRTLSGVDVSRKKKSKSRTKKLSREKDDDEECINWLWTHFNKKEYSTRTPTKRVTAREQEKHIFELNHLLA